MDALDPRDRAYRLFVVPLATLIALGGFAAFAVSAVAIVPNREFSDSQFTLIPVCVLFLCLVPASIGLLFRKKAAWWSTLALLIVKTALDLAYAVLIGSLFAVLYYGGFEILFTVGFYYATRKAFGYGLAGGKYRQDTPMLAELVSPASPGRPTTTTHSRRQSGAACLAAVSSTSRLRRPVPSFPVLGMASLVLLIPTLVVVAAYVHSALSLAFDWDHDAEGRIANSQFLLAGPMAATLFALPGVMCGIIGWQARRELPWPAITGFALHALIVVGAALALLAFVVPWW